MRDWSNVSDRRYKYPRALNRPNGRLSSRAWPTYEDLDLADAVLHTLSGRVLARSLRRERSGLPGAMESDGARASPGYRIALWVGKRDYRVVERGLYVRSSNRDRLALSSTCPWSSCHIVLRPVYFADSGQQKRYFLFIVRPRPATATRLPRLVRPLVFVLCPRTGRPRR